jgi:hypothetical protein
LVHYFLHLAPERQQIFYLAVERGQLLNCKRMNLSAGSAAAISHDQDFR